MTASTSKQVHVVGGASFPAAVGTVTVTIPLAIAFADDDGLRVDVRLRFLKRLLSRLLRSEPGAGPFWGAPWTEISSVDLGPRSLALHLGDRRGCRFVTLRRRSLLPLVRHLEERAVPVRRVRSTLPWFVSRSATAGFKPGSERAP